MQYLVRVDGEISDKKSKVYIVNSNDEKDAQIKALKNFNNEFTTNSEKVYVEHSKRTNKAIAAFILLLIPIFLSFIEWKNGHNTISISPDYLSCLYSILIYGAFVVRFKGIPRTVNSWIDILFCILIVLLLSSFIKTIIVTKTISLFGLLKIKVDSNIIVLITILLSWLGLKFVSLICMMFIVLTAFLNITALNIAMGNLWGPIYIICSFIGIMLYLSIEPAFIESLFQLKQSTFKCLNYINGDISQAKGELISMKKIISKNKD